MKTDIDWARERRKCNGDRVGEWLGATASPAHHRTNGTWWSFSNACSAIAPLCLQSTAQKIIAIFSSRSDRQSVLSVRHTCALRQNSYMQGVTMT